jgi:hypothetical protein
MKTKIIDTVRVGLTLISAVLLAAGLASCLPPAPENEPAPNLSLFVKWTINGRQPDDLICGSLGPETVSVEIWEDSDCDGDLTNGYYVYTFDCTGGVCVNPNRQQHGKKCVRDDECGDPPGYCLKAAGKTGNAFFSGTNTCMKVVLISQAEGAEPIANIYDFGGGICSGWYEDSWPYPDSGDCQDDSDCYCYLDTGAPQDLSSCTIDAENSFSTCKDLGTIDFDLPNYGPLDVDLAWEKEDGTFGACEEAGVEFMGYRLERRTEQDGETVYEVFDEVNVEGNTACGARSSWPLVPFAFYRLKVNGRNDNSSIVWESDCTGEDGGDLEVDGREEGSNVFSCQVSRL